VRLCGPWRLCAKQSMRMAGSRKDAKYRKARKTHKTKAQTPIVSTQASEMDMMIVVFKPSPVRMRFSCIAIVMLTVWLNGFGCALCCATKVTESCCVDERTASTDYGAPSCCTQAQSKRASGSADAISQLPSAIGCVLLPDQTRSLAPLTRVSTDLYERLPVDNSSFATITDPRIVPSNDPPSPLNRGGTYLRCCVLLI